MIPISHLNVGPWSPQRERYASYTNISKHKREHGQTQTQNTQPCFPYSLQHSYPWATKETRALLHRKLNLYCSKELTSTRCLHSRLPTSLFFLYLVLAGCNIRMKDAPEAKIKTYCLIHQESLLTDPRETTHMSKGRQRMGHSPLTNHCLSSTENCRVQLD